MPTCVTILRPLRIMRAGAAVGVCGQSQPGEAVLGGLDSPGPGHSPQPGVQHQVLPAAQQRVQRVKLGAVAQALPALQHRLLAKQDHQIDFIK